MKILGKSLILIGMYIAYSGTIGHPHYRTSFYSLGDMMPYLGITIVVMTIGALLLSRGLEREQKVEDANARRLFDHRSRSHTAPFALYLRSFDTTGSFRVQRSSHAFSLFDWDSVTRVGVDTLERLIADAFSKTVPLVGLGGRGDAEFGLATAGLVEDWQTAISTAMSRATYVLVVPAENAGTSWEIGELKRLGLLGKTIFIMPPQLHLTYTGKVPYDELWQAARVECESRHGLLLPEYSNAGCLFAYIGGRPDPITMELRGIDPRAIAKTVNALIDRIAAASRTA